MQSFKNPASVLIIIDTAFTGGPGKGVLQLARHFEDHNIRYVIVTFQYPSPRSTQFIDAARSQNLRLETISQRHQLDFSALKRLHEIVEDHKINIIQTHGYKGHVFAWLLRRKLPLLWLGLTHGWTYEDLKVRFYNALERVLLRFPDHVATVSPPLFAEVKALRGNRPCSLILNAVDCHQSAPERAENLRQSLEIRSDTTVFLSAGRLSPEKGHSILLKAWKRFNKEFTNSRLLLVGDGTERRSLEDYCQQNNLNSSVTFCGYQNELSPYYDLAAAFVLPSLSEGLPNVLLESLASRTMFIGSAVGAIPDVIDSSSGLLVPPGDVDALTAALLRYQQMSPEDRETMTREGQQRLNPTYSAAGRADRFLTIYRELLGQESGPASPP